jgi:radical SAM superfamily enzyme YgiQ (UPF0313 family)
MRTLLVFPPQGHFTQPYLALPSLAAYLRAQGFDDVHLMDASIEAYEHFLEPGRLARSLERVRASGRLERLQAQPSLGYSELVAYRSLTQAELCGEWAIAGIEDAKAVLRDRERFYDVPSYLRAARCIEQALALVSAEHYPSVYSAHGFSMRHSIQRTDDIVAGAQDEQGNPFIEFFREVTLPRIQALDPDLVGISVTFTSQAIPAFTLAAMLKAWRPDIHVTMGGGLFAYVGHKLARRADVFDFVDSIVMLEGERPLARIAEAVASGGGLEGIPNIIYRDAAGQVQVNPEVEPLDIDSLPTPDFEGLPLERYLSPEFIVPLAITRGCYWGKCVFCTLHQVIGPGYRGRSLERTIEDIAALKQRWGSRYFYFPIEDLPPDMVKRLPDALLEADLDIEWWCDAKLEPKVFTPATCEKLARAGCRRLAFGYESASQRVLDLMCKGSRADEGMDVIRRVHDAGISVTLYVMVGFPTETAEEAQQTRETLLANRDVFEEASARVFYLDEKSEIFKRREEFAIDQVFPDEGADLQVYYDFTTSEGMTRSEARRTYLELVRVLRSHLPVFQERNLLYHELKSHYFLYLVRAGGVKPLLEGPFAAQAAERRRPVERPRMAPGLRFLATSFDRGEVDAAIERAHDGLCLPRYQFDLITGGVAEQLDARVPRLGRAEAYAVLDPRTGDISSLSPDGVALIGACDGKRSLANLLSEHPADQREVVLEFLEGAARGGLLCGAASEGETQ